MHITYSFNYVQEYCLNRRGLSTKTLNMKRNTTPARLGDVNLPANSINSLSNNDNGKSDPAIMTLEKSILIKFPIFLRS